MTRLLLPVALLVLTCAGCPKPQEPQKSKTAAKTGSDRQAKPGAGGDDGGGEGPGKEAEGVPDLPPWKVLRRDLVENRDFWPQLRPAAVWPDPRSLTPLAKVAEAKRPDDVRRSHLRSLAELIVHRSLLPRDLDGALALDDRGRLFLRLGRSKVEGAASQDVRTETSRFPVFALSLQREGKGAQDQAALLKRVKAALNPKVAAELKPGKRLVDSPFTKGPGDAAFIFRFPTNGPSGIGVQFQYLYAYGSADHLLILLQEVPRMGPPK